MPITVKEIVMGTQNLYWMQKVRKTKLNNGDDDEEEVTITNVDKNDK